DDRRVDLAELRELVAEAAGLRRAARGVVLRIEIEHHGLAAQALERDFPPAIGRQGEIGGGLADGDGHQADSCFSVFSVGRAAAAGASIRVRQIAVTASAAWPIFRCSASKSTAP